MAFVQVTGVKNLNMMVMNYLLGFIFFILGIVLIKSRQKIDIPSNAKNYELLNLIFHKFGLGYLYIGIGLWNIFIFNIDNLIIKWVNINFLYLIITISIILSILDIYFKIQNAKNKKK
jgi:hypothetical protein